VEEGVTLRDFVQIQLDLLSARLDESAIDRARIRDELNTRTARTSFELLVQRVELLERQQSRLYGGLGVIALLLALLGVVLRYVVG